MKKIFLVLFAVLVLNVAQANAGYEFYTNEAEFLAQLTSYETQDFTGLNQDLNISPNSYPLAFGDEIDGTLYFNIPMQINADNYPAEVKGLVVEAYASFGFEQDIQAFGFNFNFFGTGRFLIDALDKDNSQLHYEVSDPGEYFYGIVGRDSLEHLLWPTLDTLGSEPFAIIQDFHVAASDEVEPEYVSAVPVPAAIWLLGSGLAGLLGFGGRFRRR